MVDKKKKSVGRPAYSPTMADRARVTDMSGRGLSQEECAFNMGISVETLVKYFEEEYKLGKAKAHDELSNKLYQLAMSGDFSALKFALKSKYGWRDTDTVEVTGKDGGAIEVSNDSQLRLIQDVFKMAVKEQEQINKIKGNDIDNKS